MTAFARWWPADLHVIGKDIARFHTIFWPAMLWSAGLEAPRHVWVHGWLLAAGGERMSKSRGNFLDPNDFVAAFGSDGARYVVLREVPFDRDAEVSWDSFVRRYNADLANDFGNLVNRTVSMTNRYLDGERPAPTPEPAEARRSRRSRTSRRAGATSCRGTGNESRAASCTTRRRSSGSSSVRPTSSSTPRSRGSWPRPRRRATRRPGSACAACWATCVEACRLSASRSRRTCRAPRRGSWPSWATTIRTAPTATAARRSSRSWPGAPTRANPVGSATAGARSSRASRPKPRPT